jgi:hypothetical protein
LGLLEELDVEELMGPIVHTLNLFLTLVSSEYAKISATIAASWSFLSKKPFNSSAVTVSGSVLMSKLNLRFILLVAINGSMEQRHYYQKTKIHPDHYIL